MADKPKIKIARIITRLNVGGPSFHTILLTANMDPVRFETLFIRGLEEKDEGSMDYLAREKGIETVLIPSMGREVRLWNDLKAAYRIYKILRDFKPDIVHTHLAKAGFVGRVAAILVGKCKIVHTFHGHWLYGYWGKAKTSFFKFLESRLANRSDCLIAVSDKVRKDIIAENVVKPDKIITIHLGLELNRFLELDQYKGNFRAELGVNADTVLVGVIARLVPIKNHSLFIKAASRVKHDNIRFLIIGDGELRERLEELAQKSSSPEKFIFTGFRNDLEKIYSDLDISVLSSLNEGLPVAVIESMAAGVPVVSTDVGGIHELIDDGVNGFIVPSEDTNALADKIAALANSPDLRVEFGTKAREAVYPYFDYSRLVKDIEDLYKCLVEDNEFMHLQLRGFRQKGNVYH